MSGLGDLKYLLAEHSVASGAFDPNQAKKIKQDRYFSLMRGINMTSYSTLGNLHACPRKFQLGKLEQAAAYELNIDGINQLETNIDFAYGKTIETGVQGVFLNKTPQEIFFDMFLAWEMPLNQMHPRGDPKTFTDACIMIDRFKWIRQEKFAGWELAYFNDKPAVELSFLIDLGNGYHYAGHADIILFHPFEQRYRVLEIKTTGRKWLHEAMYKNSDQAVGYSVVLDSVARDIEMTATFEVFYLILLSSLSKFEVYEFTKSRSNRADWLNTLLMDTHMTDMYKRSGHWPKRGASCFDYMRPCKYFGICDMEPTNFKPDGEFSVLSEKEIAEHTFDFRFKLQDIIETQTELI